MKILLRAWNGEAYAITSRDPGLIARWIIEMIATIQPRQGTPAMLMAFPTLDRHGAPDWVTDSRAAGQAWPITGLTDFVEALRAQIAVQAGLEGSPAWAPVRTEPGPCYGDRCDHASHHA
jgi:hypothetical protein